MTQSEVKAKLAAVGISFRGRDNEYRVNYRGGSEATAYYTTDLDDALETGRVMANSPRSTWIDKSHSS